MYEVLCVMVMIGRIPGQDDLSLRTPYFGQKYSRLNGFGSGAWGAVGVSVLVNIRNLCLLFINFFYLLILDIMTSIGDRHRPRFWGLP